MSNDELAAARRWLGNDRCVDLFLAQPAADQRHGFDAGAWLSERGCPGWMVQAGMLHDVGKRHADLGRWGRAVSTAVGWVRVVPPGRMSLYTAHGSTGAKELALVGVDPRVVAYTAHHHGRRPAELTHDEWATLDEADRRN